MREHGSGDANPRADGGGSIADRVHHRPSRPRPPLLALLGEAGCARLAGADTLCGRAGTDGRLVSRQRLVVGVDPLGRVSRVLRAPLWALAQDLRWRPGRPAPGGVTLPRPR